MNSEQCEIRYEASGDWKETTQHGLLAEVYEFAQASGLFKVMEELKYQMKKVVSTPADKLKTLWASIVVGCHHTVEINEQFGEHEQAMAEVFGLKRFPDQSQVNRVLKATSEEQVETWREGHLRLLSEHSRAGEREVWW